MSILPSQRIRAREARRLTYTIHTQSNAMPAKTLEILSLGTIGNDVKVVTRHEVADFYLLYRDFGSGAKVSSAAHFIKNNIESEATIADIDKVLKQCVRIGYNNDTDNLKQKTHVWLHISTSQPISQFDKARWHQDGPYMTVDPERTHDARYKYCVTLLGPGTIFLEQSGTELPEVASKALEEGHGWQSKAGEVVQCTWKSVADDVPSDVHTEPPHGVDRIFLAVVFMSEEEHGSLVTHRK